MMSTIGRELLSLINSDLTWKKGNRSNSRRKPAFRNIIMGTDEGVRMGDDPTTTSDTEKNGVDILGRHFRDKLEHVPIKKRRFQVGSPSWLKQSSPSGNKLIESDSFCKRQRRGCDVSPASRIVPKSEGGIDCKPDSSEDFSGIEILATVACDNDKGITESTGVLSCPSLCESIKIERSPSISAFTCEKSVETAEDTVQTEHAKSMCKCDEHHPLRSSDSRNDTSVYEAVSSRVHWDLNVTMDAWETPCSTMTEDRSVDSLQVGVNPNDAVVQNDLVKLEVPENIKNDFSENVKDLVIKGNLRENASRQEAVPTSLTSEIPDHCGHSLIDPSPATVDTLEVVNQTPHGNGVQMREQLSPSTDLEQSLEIRRKTIYSFEEVSPITVEKKEVSCASNTSTDTNKSLSETDLSTPNNEGDARPMEITEQEVPLECLGSPLVQVKSLSCELPLEGCAASTTAEHTHDGFSSVPVAAESQERDECEESLEKSPYISVALNSPENEHEEPMYESSPSTSLAANSPELDDDDDCAADDEVMEKAPPSSSFVVKSRQDRDDELMPKSSPCFPSMKSPPHDGYELVQKSSVDSTVTQSAGYGERFSGPLSSLTKPTIEDGDNSESNIYMAEKIQAVCSEEVAGYDSQFEDGELRESNARSVDDNEERPCFDESTNVTSEPCSSIGNVRDCKEGKKLTQPKLLKTKKSRVVVDCQKIEAATTIATTSEVTGEKEVSDVTRSKASTKNSLSSTGRLNVIRAKDSQTRARMENDPSSIKDEKETSIKKLIPTEKAGYNQGRSPKGRQFGCPSSGYWNSERRSSPLGPYKSAPLRPKNVLDHRGYPLASDHSEFDTSSLSESDNRMPRNYLNMPSDGQYERFPRRTPNDRDEGYSGVPRSVLSNRGISPGRNNFARYHEGLNEARNEYHRPLPDDVIGYPNRQRLVRRERSTSPLRGRRPFFPMVCRKSRSRSRSRSPGYFEPRELNGPRFHSRSPDFRLNRERMPFQKRLPAEYGEDISSSRQHGPRCFDDRSVSVNRKSPGRPIRSSQRFDPGHGFPRLNPAAPYRPPLHSRKFADMSGASNGGDYDDEEDDRRKGRDRFDVIHRMRPYDNEGGDVRRFRCDMEDSFGDNEWRLNSDAPYKPTMQSRRVNPSCMWRLNSDSPYRPSMHSRKFGDAAGGGVVRNEYGENDGDRRKGRDRYDMVPRLRRFGPDGAVRRFRYDAEDLFLVNDTHNFNESSKKLTDRRTMNDE